MSRSVSQSWCRFAGFGGLLLLASTFAGCSDDSDPVVGSAGSGGGAGTSVGQAGATSVAGASAVGGSGGSSAGTSSVAGAAGTSSGGSAAGAGGSSSGGSGGGGGNAGSGGSSSGACTHKLCEDFESGATGALSDGWTKFKGYGAGAATDVGLAGDAFRSGKQSLKSSSMATGQTRAQRSLSALGATASKHWGRIFYKVQSPATKPSSGVLHVTFVGLMGNSENRVVDIVENTQGKHQWLYNNPDDAGGLGSAYDWTFDDAWHCAEWFVDVGTKSYKFFSDSKEVPSIGFTGKNDAQMSDYKSIIVGAEFYQMPPTPFVMWFDDLAIDDNQIGCQ
ncbi:MAG TPA: hypothetical protein VHP33_13070 [Polyangiaceae bacterium]|nr:hypothetical protein [Polyangiaceae bacterium]